MSKVMVFMGDLFYPGGGWEDFKGYFEDIESAKEFILSNSEEISMGWAHIVHEDKIIIKAELDKCYKSEFWEFEGV